MLPAELLVRLSGVVDWTRVYAFACKRVFGAPSPLAAATDYVQGAVEQLRTLYDALYRAHGSRGNTSHPLHAAVEHARAALAAPPAQLVAMYGAAGAADVITGGRLRPVAAAAARAVSSALMDAPALSYDAAPKTLWRNTPKPLGDYLAASASVLQWALAVHREAVLLHTLVNAIATAACDVCDTVGGVLSAGVLQRSTAAALALMPVGAIGAFVAHDDDVHTQLEWHETLGWLCAPFGDLAQRLLAANMRMAKGLLPHNGTATAVQDTRAQWAVYQPWQAPHMMCVHPAQVDVGAQPRWYRDLLLLWATRFGQGGAGREWHWYPWAPVALACLGMPRAVTAQLLAMDDNEQHHRHPSHAHSHVFSYSLAAADLRIACEVRNRCAAFGWLHGSGVVGVVVSPPRRHHHASGASEAAKAMEVLLANISSAVRLCERQSAQQCDKALMHVYTELERRRTADAQRSHYAVAALTSKTPAAAQRRQVMACANRATLLQHLVTELLPRIRGTGTAPNNWRNVEQRIAFARLVMLCKQCIQQQEEYGGTKRLAVDAGAAIETAECSAVKLLVRRGCFSALNNVMTFY